MSSPPEISLVIPALNEAESLPRLLGEIAAALDSGPAYEVLVVDDGSDDGTAEAALRVAASAGRLRVFRHPANQGQSASLATGFRHARGAVVVTLDADLQNDPADIPRLVAALADCDLVSGVRVDRRDSWLRRASSRIANRVRNGLLHDAVTDVGCSLKAYRAEVLREVPPFDGFHRFLPALVRMRGGRVKELPVSHRPRRFGASKYGIHNRLWRALADLLGVWWLGRRRLDPGAAEEVTRWTAR